MRPHISRRDFMASLGGAGAWPLIGRAQQSALPMPAISKNLITDFGAAGDGIADDTTSFMNFRAWAVAWQESGNAGQIELVLDSGHTFLLGSSIPVYSNAFTTGIKKLLISASGASLTTGRDYGFWIGGPGVSEDDIKCALFATANAGASSITLRTPSQHSRFTIGQWIMLSGGDLMGWGWPPNPFVFEYLKISGINSETGTISFETPLLYSYKSTWPSVSGIARLGGPATIYALSPNWDTEVEVVGLTISSNNLPTVCGRYVKLTNCTPIYKGDGRAGFFAPSAAHTIIIENMNQSSGLVEVDKCITNLIIEGGRFSNILFQSANSVTNFAANNAAIDYLNCLPESSLLRNCTISTRLTLGGNHYGNVKKAEFVDCLISGDVNATGAMVHNVEKQFSMNDGIIRLPMGQSFWATPGALCTFLRYDGAKHFEGSPFIILDITGDANYVYVTTSLTRGFPSLPTTDGQGLSICGLPVPIASFSGCTGNPIVVDQSQAGARRRPLFSYTKRVFDTAMLLPVSGAIGVPIFGQIVSVKVNVTKAYTGVHSPLKMLLFIPTINSRGTQFNFTPVINLSAAGERAIFPGSVTGVRPGDTIVAADAWIEAQYNATVSSDFSAESSSVWPSVTIEIITDQGIGITSKH
jgi:hypothetical protein